MLNYFKPLTSASHEIVVEAQLTSYTLINKNCPSTKDHNWQPTQTGIYTLSKKSSWTLLKVQLLRKCFIISQLKAYHRKQVDVFFNLIPNL